MAIAVTVLIAVGGFWSRGRHLSAVRGGTREQTDAASDRLAVLVAVRWRQEAIARRIVTPAPATVRWRWAAEEVAAPISEVTRLAARGSGPLPYPGFEEPGELLESGVVTRLHDEVYARLPHGRLILIGGAGAGKTGAMILLLLAALDRRAFLGGEQRNKVPVPVWLTLSGWNPVTTPLQEWAAFTMKRDYPALQAADYGPDAAGELLRGGRVALFLDGLDEMPRGLRRRALERVDEEASGLRVVATSRPAEYRGAVQSGGLNNTAVIELRPVRPNAAAAYLLHGHTGLRRHQWELVGVYLKRSPNSVTARALDNPLTLSLARDSYTDRDPVALIDPGTFPTESAFREHLIDQLMITAYPDEQRRAHVIRWLAWIAHQMGPSRELPWWDIPAWVPQWKLRLTRGLAVGLPIGAAGAFAASHLIGLVVGPVHGPVAAVTVGTVGAVGGGIGSDLRGGGYEREPRTLAPRWPNRGQFAWILRNIRTVGTSIGLAVGLAGALAAGIASGSPAQAGGGFAVFYLVGLAFGAAVGAALALSSVWAAPIADGCSSSGVR